MTDSCYLMREFKESIFLPYRLSASKARGGFADLNAMGYISQDLNSRDTELHWDLQNERVHRRPTERQMWSGCNDELKPII